MENSYEYLINLARKCNFYQNNNYKNSDINTWPIIDKFDIIQNYDKFTDKINKKECIKCSTTGSTGLVLDTFWTPKDYYNSLLHMWRIRRKYGIYPYSTYCTCHANAYLYDTLLKHRTIIDRSQISFSKIVTDDKILHNYIKIMVEYNVQWYLLQPSLLLKLILYGEKNNLHLPQVHYIECTGEKLYNETKDYISNQFPKSIIVDSYGMQEFNTIGYNIGNGFNILSDNVYVEILHNNRKCEEGEIGDIVVSGLCNTLMPYIRYKTGDRGAIVGGKLFLDSTSNNDSITRNGKTYDASVFWVMIEHLRLLGYPIVQFRFVSKNNELYCDIFLRDNTVHSSDIAEKMKSYLYEKHKLEFDRVNITIKDLQEYLTFSEAKHFYFKAE